MAIPPTRSAFAATPSAPVRLLFTTKPPPASAMRRLQATSPERGAVVAASTSSTAPVSIPADTAKHGSGRSGSVRKVEFPRTPKQGCTSSTSWAASVCDAVERAVVWAFDGGVADEAAYLLSDNYAPVSEMAPVPDLPISGSIPACLNGEFLRVGPNPRFMPVSRYHWFDGDGMIHGLNIRNGKATYVARYVQTARLQQEEYYGAAKFLKVKCSFLHTNKKLHI